MILLSTVLTVAHLIGLALGAGAATMKLVLLLRCRADHAFVPVYMRIVKLITRQIVLGMVLLTFSGIGWLLLGHPFTTLLVAKIVLVVAIWVLGPVIDNVVEPRFKTLAPALGEQASPAFIRIQRQYLSLEVIATSLFYVVLVIWVQR